MWIALALIVGSYVLLALGRDGFAAATLTTIAGYYFGIATAQTLMEKENKDASKSKADN